MNARGFSLVEALVALALLGVTAVAVLPAFVTHLDANTRNEERSEAMLAAQQKLDSLRLVDPETMAAVPGPPDSETVTFDDRDYLVETYYCVRTEYCPPTNPSSRHLTVEVFLDGRKIYDVETVYTQLR